MMEMSDQHYSEQVVPISTYTDMRHGSSKVTIFVRILSAKCMTIHSLIAEFGHCLH